MMKAGHKGAMAVAEGMRKKEETDVELAPSLPRLPTLRPWEPRL